MLNYDETMRLGAHRYADALTALTKAGIPASAATLSEGAPVGGDGLRELRTRRAVALLPGRHWVGKAIRKTRASWVASLTVATVGSSR